MTLKVILGRGLATAVWNLDTGLQLASRVHKTPFIFPFFSGGIVYDLPRLIKGLEPIVLVRMSSDKNSNKSKT